MNLEFKFNYYFELYKETPILSNENFKMKFIKKHGDFIYLNELVIMINKYQVKKYGTNLNNFIKQYKSYEDIKREKLASRQRNMRRFGSRLEQRRRKYNDRIGKND